MHVVVAQNQTLSLDAEPIVVTYLVWSQARWISFNHSLVFDLDVLLVTLYEVWAWTAASILLLRTFGFSFDLLAMLCHAEGDAAILQICSRLGIKNATCLVLTPIVPRHPQNWGKRYSITIQ